MKAKQQNNERGDTENDLLHGVSIIAQKQQNFLLTGTSG
jgi:hypothetical protein